MIYTERDFMIVVTLIFVMGLVSGMKLGLLITDWIKGRKSR